MKVEFISILTAAALSQGRKPVLFALLFAALLLLLSGDNALAQTRNDFVYWDANGNGDLTCTEARGKDEGLKLPAYADNRNGTRVIYEWLERRTSSDTDNDGIACESTSNPNGYVFGSITPLVELCHETHLRRRQPRTRAMSSRVSDVDGLASLRGRRTRRL